MRRGHDSRARRVHGGFTLVETLGVIAVLVVVMALAAPNVIQMRKDLRIAELDAKAEQIYNAVQYQLTSLKASGRFDADSSALAGLAHDAARAIPDGGPQDYAFSEAAVDGTYPKDSLRYALKADDVTSKYLFSGSSNGTAQASAAVSNGVTGGSFVVEASPETGEVYAVFYWESDAEAKDGISPSSADSYYRAMSSSRDGEAGRNADRVAHNVGYYRGGKVDLAGGDDPSSGSSSKSSSGPAKKPFEGGLRLSIVNEEELYVKIDTSSGLNATDFDVNKLHLSILIQEVKFDDATDSITNQALINVNGGSTHPEVPKGIAADHVIAGDSLEYDSNSDTEVDYILDSLYKDANGNAMSFKVRTNNLIGAGSDVLITVFVTYDDPLIQEKLGPERRNSQFADYAFDYGGSTVGVTSTRHLQNLANLDFYTNVMYVNIESDIQFDGTTWNDESVATKNHRDREDKNPLSGRASEYFMPIDLGNKFNGGNDRIIQGNNHVFEGFKIGNPSSPADYTGLFKTLKCKVENLTLKDFDVVGAKNTGALAGYVEGNAADASGCKVLGGKVVGTENVGGLVGYAARTDIHDSVVSIDVEGSGANVGGAVGFGQGAHFYGYRVTVRTDDEGNVSVPTVTGASNVGGLVGYHQNGYADPYSSSGGEAPCTVTANVVSKGDNAGGFVGYADNGCEYRKCQVTAAHDSDGAPVVSTVDASGNYVGGFVGRSQGALQIYNCAVEADVSSSGDYVGGFLGGMPNGGWSKIEDCAVNASYNTKTGTVRLSTASGGSYVGGFAGHIYQVNSLRRCESHANVVGSGNVIGGFVGYLQDDWATNNMDNCKASGVMQNGAEVKPVVRGSGSAVDAYVAKKGQGEFGADSNCYSTLEVKAA